MGRQREREKKVLSFYGTFVQNCVARAIFWFRVMCVGNKRGGVGKMLALRLGMVALIHLIVWLCGCIGIYVEKKAKSGCWNEYGK